MDMLYPGTLNGLALDTLLSYRRGDLPAPPMGNDTPEDSHVQQITHLLTWAHHASLQPTGSQGNSVCHGQPPTTDRVHPIYMQNGSRGHQLSPHPHLPPLSHSPTRSAQQIPGRDDPQLPPSRREQAALGPGSDAARPAPSRQTLPSLSRSHGPTRELGPHAGTAGALTPQFSQGESHRVEGVLGFQESSPHPSRRQGHSDVHLPCTPTHLPCLPQCEFLKLRE